MVKTKQVSKDMQIPHSFPRAKWDRNETEYYHVKAMNPLSVVLSFHIPVYWEWINLLLFYSFIKDIFSSFEYFSEFTYQDTNFTE